MMTEISNKANDLVIIAELEEAQRWIPVSEPPKTDGTYLLRNIYEDVYSCDFIADTNTWVLSEYDSITHWMPLPKLPEVSYGIR